MSQMASSEPMAAAVARRRAARMADVDAMTPEWRALVTPTPPSRRSTSKSSNKDASEPDLTETIGEAA